MKWTSPIILLVFAFAAVFVEASFGGVRRVLGAQIDLLPALMVYASLSSNVRTMSVLAVVGGLWFDSLSFNPPGVSILPLFIVGFAIYPRRALILRDQLYAQFMLGMIACAVAPALTLLLLLNLGQNPVLGWGTLWQWVVMSLGGGMLTPVCFRLLDALNRGLMYRPLYENNFRPDREIRRGRN